jgi:hypothetical protein
MVVNLGPSLLQEEWLHGNWFWSVRGTIAVAVWY